MGPAVHHVPWTDDVHRFIDAADVVIAGAGDGVVNEVMSCRRPLVCIPETRPFDEQTSKAQLLENAGAALSVTGWDAARPWLQTLERALALDLGAQALLVDGRGAARAAAHVDGLAAELVRN
jgi:UDP-N-acetylglucosamine:LPS N-acetylglucosamine transferase